jgi:hypothetical protein
MANEQLSEKSKELQLCALRGNPDALKEAAGRLIRLCDKQEENVGPRKDCCWVCDLVDYLLARSEIEKPVGLYLTRLAGESWKDAAERVASHWGLQREVMDIYTAEVAAGVPEAEAALNACYEWDVLSMRPGPAQPLMPHEPPTIKGDKV